MAEKPILFKGEMVRAILGGRKSQTRRAVKPMRGDQSGWLKQETIGKVPHGEMIDGGWQMHHPLAGQQHVCHLTGSVIDEPHDSPLGWVKCPYGEPGDLLWVRETFAKDGLCKGFLGDQKPSILYRASDEADRIEDEVPFGIKWKPSIFMPRWASRITLKVKSVRVERVQDITNNHAIDEGIHGKKTETPRSYNVTCMKFSNLWDSINCKRPGCSWGENPWVWVISFEKWEPSP